MLFNSIQYLGFFLPLALLVYIAVGRFKLGSAQLLWLVGCSLFFYASWNPVFVLLMLASVMVNFGFGRLIASSERPSSSKIALIGGVSFNLGLLGYFKYTGFFVENLNSLAGTLIPMPEITLPLAISFFTFQQIAYLVDVYRSEAREYSFGHYCLFVTFFPQLIAGPIVHHKEMMPQFEQTLGRTIGIENIQVGITIIVLGLFKKVILADNLALLSDPLFQRAEGGSTLSFTEAWVAVSAFTGQIYFDFSGYTDIAIGSARLFGIKLPENFYSPYKSRNIIEFWRRWHITLSRFLRDYLYISLGGNRKGPVKRYRNLLLTMLLGGLWHGAHWNFVIWGALHGGYLVVNHLIRHLFPEKPEAESKLHWLTTFLSHCLTLLAVMIAWVFFRAESTSSAFSILNAMYSFDNFSLNESYIQGIYALQPAFELVRLAAPDLPIAFIPLMFLSLSLFLCLFAPNTQQFMSKFEPALIVTKWPRTAGRFLWSPSTRYAVVIALLGYISFIGMGSTSEFIYFQF